MNTFNEFLKVNENNIKISSASDVKKGETIEYWSYILEKSISSVVSDTDFWNNLIHLKDNNTIDVSHMTVYKILPKCDCGARFTSNPKHHYDWCSVSL